MTALAHDNLQNLKPWRVRSPRLFPTLAVVVSVLLYLIYSLHIDIPETIFLVFFVLAIPFFKEKDYLSLGACLPLLKSIPGTVTVLGIAALFYFFRFGRRARFSNIYWIVMGFMCLELFDGITKVNFNWHGFIWWGIMLAYFALSVCIIRNVTSDDLLEVMRNYVLMYSCVVFVLVQRYAMGAGSFADIFLGHMRLGAIKDATAGAVVEGLSYNPNALGYFSILCVGICLIFLHLGLLRRWLWLGAAAFATMVGFMTLSRTFAVMFFAFAIIYFLNYSSVKCLLVLTPITIVLLIGLVIAAYGLSDAFATIVDNMIARFTTKGDVTAGRIDLWYAWNELYLNTPSIWLTGMGVNGLDEQIWLLGIFNCIHNGYQETYVYWGVLGFVLALCLQLIVYRICKKPNGGKLLKYNYVMMIVFYLYIAAGQYLSNSVPEQIIPAVVMAYPFWKHKKVVVEYSKFLEN